MGLGLGGGSHAGDLKFGTEARLVGDVVGRKEIRGGNVLQIQAVCSVDGLAIAILASSSGGNNFPDSVVGLLVVGTDFLVARVASKGHWGQGKRVQVELTIVEVLVRGESNVLTVSDAGVFAFICVFNSKDGAGRWVLLIDGGSDSKGIAGDHLLVDVDDEGSASVARRKHDRVARMDGPILSEGESGTVSSSG